MDQKTDDLIAAFVAAGNDFEDWIPQYSIAPTDVIPIIRERNNGHTGEITRNIEAAVWDFHPPFMKDAKRPQFNARLETVATNGLWKGAFTNSRCIIPMRGYFEWSEELDSNGKTFKQPHFIHGKSALLAAAGIYTARKIDAEWVVSVAIITREAKDASGEVHDRMPAFVTPDVYDKWLSPQKLETDSDKSEALVLLTEASSEIASTITTYLVDRRVNSSRSVNRLDRTIIEPI